MPVRFVYNLSMILDIVIRSKLKIQRYFKLIFLHS